MNLSKNPNPNLDDGYRFIEVRGDLNPLDTSLMDPNTIHGLRPKRR